MYKRVTTQVLAVSSTFQHTTQRTRQVESEMEKKMMKIGGYTVLSSWQYYRHAVITITDLHMMLFILIELSPSTNDATASRVEYFQRLISRPFL